MDILYKKIPHVILFTEENIMELTLILTISTCLTMGNGNYTAGGSVERLSKKADKILSAAQNGFSDRLSDFPLFAFGNIDDVWE